MEAQQLQMTMNVIIVDLLEVKKMVDSGYYLKDATISAHVFNGNTVPGDNTIQETPNDTRKKTCNIQVNKVFNWTSQQSDPNNILEDYALMIYKRIVKGEDPKFSKPEKRELALLYYADEDGNDNAPGLITNEDYL